MRQFPRQVSRLALWSRQLAGFALAVVLVGIALTRWMVFPQDKGLISTASGVVLAAIALLLAIAAYVEIWRTGAIGLVRANIGALLALAILAVPLWQVTKAFSLPPINDVSTDPVEVPAFSRSRAALAARGGYVPDLPGEATRHAQQKAYADLEPVILDMAPDEAFDLVLEVAGDLKWQVIEKSAPSGRSGTGRIEAMARTVLMRFVDDITIRIRPHANGTRVDIRSASRIGQHDLGANAARIRAFAEALQDAAKP
mgnify:CR=1 FL=1